MWAIVVGTKNEKHNVLWLLAMYAGITHTTQTYIIAHGDRCCIIDTRARFLNHNVAPLLTS